MASAKRTLVLALTAALLGGCGLTGIVALWLWKGPSLGRPSSPRYSYWNDACVTSDETLMAAGGAGFTVLDLASGAVVGRGDEDVHAVACPGPRAVVLGYESTWTWPGGARGAAAQPRGERVVAAFEDGTRVWAASRTSRGKSVGPLVLTVERGAATRRLELGPQDFGEVGRAKTLPFPDSFCMWPGRVPQNHRLLLAAGWEPNRSGSWVEDVPWGFFMLDVENGRVDALLPPAPSDAALHLVRRPAVGASADAATLALATSNGTDGVVAIYTRPNGASVRTTFAGWDEISRLAVAPDGSRVAVASAFHGEDRPAHIVMLDSRDGRRLWGTEVAASVYGLALLRDGSLVWASSGRAAARVAFSEPRVAWHTQVDAATR